MWTRYAICIHVPSDDVICDVALLCGRLPAAHYSTGAAVMPNNSLREMCDFDVWDLWIVRVELVSLFGITL